MCKIVYYCPYINILTSENGDWNEEDATTNKNVSEVAYQVGFSSPSYFTKCFKEYFGKSPSDIANG